jgi:CxxC motif-containing protein
MTELICIVCPKGCHLKVDEATLAVTGNSCPRGEEYGRTELKNPTRTISSTVAVEGAAHRRCPVKTDGVIPKGMILPAMKTLDGVVLTAPVKLGQIVVEDVCGTGVRFVTTRGM